MVKIARVVSALKSCTHGAFLAILAIFNGSNKHTVQAAARYSPPASQPAAANSCATTRLNPRKTNDNKDAVLWRSGRSSANNALGCVFESERWRARKY